MIRVANLDQFHAQVAAWIKSVEKGAELVAMNMAHEALRDVTKFGPQFSGQFVASWNLSVGTPDTTSYQPESVLRGDNVVPYKEGDPDAINVALGRNIGKLKGFKLGQSIFLTNEVEHDEPYSWMIEENQIAFRPENPSKGRTLHRAASSLALDYAKIGGAQILRLIGT